MSDLLERHFLNSSYREKLLEHLFVGELLKISWRTGSCSLEIAKPEVDYQGYDLIAEDYGVVRHIQLKASYMNAKTARQKVHVALADKPSGCVVWIYFNAQTLDMGPFLFFGDVAGKPLPDLSSYRVARHTKGDSQGVKVKRPSIRIINKGRFRRYQTIEHLYHILFEPEQQGETINV